MKIQKQRLIDEKLEAEERSRAIQKTHAVRADAIENLYHNMHVTHTKKYRQNHF